MDVLLSFVERHLFWTLAYLVCGWWPLCFALANFGPFVVTVKRGPE